MVNCFKLLECNNFLFNNFLFNNFLYNYFCVKILNITLYYRYNIEFLYVINNVK